MTTSPSSTYTNEQANGMENSQPISYRELLESVVLTQSTEVNCSVSVNPRSIFGDIGCISESKQ